MTYQDAFDHARQLCTANGVPMVVVHDPAGRDDWETEAEAYGFCPEYMMPTAYRFGTLICTLRPVPKGVEIKPGRVNPRA